MSIPGKLSGSGIVSLSTRLLSVAVCIRTKRGILMTCCAHNVVKAIATKAASTCLITCLSCFIIERLLSH